MIVSDFAQKYREIIVFLALVIVLSVCWTIMFMYDLYHPQGASPSPESLIDAKCHAWHDAWCWGSSNHTLELEDLPTYTYEGHTHNCAEFLDDLECRRYDES